MYESFFGLARRPFAAAADADCYYPATAIENARQTLFRCIDRGEGAALLIGPAGAGKSLLLQVLAEQFKGRFGIALLGSGRFNTRRELLQAILYELGLPYRDMEEGELRLALIDHLSAPRRLETAATGVRRDGNSTTGEHEGMLLLIDEAHTLPLKLLEEVRLITNLVRGGQPKVRLVLAGSSALEERFTSPKLDAFNQRISARCYLQAFDRNETCEYIKAQIEWAGGQPKSLFASDSLDAVHQATQGVPRLVNQVCDHALLLACAAGATTLGRAAVEEAWADLQQLPTPWNRDASAPIDAAQSGEVIEFGILEDEPAADIISTNEPAADLDEFAIDEAGEEPRKEEHVELDLSEGEPIDFDSYDEVEADGRMVGGSEGATFQPAAVLTNDFAGQDPLRRLAEVERQIAAIDDDRSSDLEPATSWPDTAVSFGTFDPFNESFAQEELVIDPFAMTAVDALINRPLVECEEGRKLGRLLKPLADYTAPKLTVAAPLEIAEFTEAGDFAEADKSEAIDDVVEGEADPPVAAIFGFVNSAEVETGAPAVVWRPDDDRLRATTIELPISQPNTVQLVADEPMESSSCRIRAGSSGEPELIVIEDDAPQLHQVTVVRRGQYRQLFSNLRRG
jgi:type II secretory pathway predicted ATPase ExeA